jgi:hypothetical protein
VCIRPIPEVPHENFVSIFQREKRERIFSKQLSEMKVRILAMIMCQSSKLYPIKNLTVRSTIFPHRNIRKHTWTYPDEPMHIQIDHVFIYS